LRFDLEGSLKYGPVTGFAQTPRGGAPGTTSPNRPTFRQLGIDEVLIPDASVGLRWRGHGLYSGGSWIRLDGQTTLDTTLISQGTTFPAGTAVNSEVRLDWYRLGYKYRFALANEMGETFALSPAAGVALLDFDYRLNGEGLLANRSYIVGTPQMGLEVEWIPSGRISVVGGSLSSLPEVSNLFLLSARLDCRCRLWGTARRGGMLFLGVGYEWINYEDNQTRPNHVKADAGPLLRFGLQTHF
jgi:hypothetical protein